MENALTLKTRTAYERANKVYMEFVQMHFQSSFAFSLTVDKLVLFISFCYQKQLVPQTVTTYISALAHFDKMHGFSADTTQNFWVKKSLQGFQKLQKKCSIRLPITPQILQKIVASLETCTSSFYQVSFQAMYLLAFRAFLRVGEITSSSLYQATLNMSSIQFDKYLQGTPQEMHLTLKDFKHHYGKPPVTLQLSMNEEDPSLCAVSAMWDYCKVRGVENGPLFMFQDKQAVSRQHFNQQL